jgi:5-hydroxyisourate hydrolase-like protein (transthyretin family)
MKPLQIALSAGASIRGHVVNKDGSPAAEVMVMAENKVANSGPDGSFVVEELEPGPVELNFVSVATNGQPQKKTVTAPANDVKLILAAMRKLSGHVVDASTGAPVQKFTVEASSAAVEYGIPQPFQTTTGEFTIDAPEGDVSLSVSAAGFAPSAKTPVDAATADPLTIKLSHGRTLRGHVVDEKGQPVAGVTFGNVARSWESSGDGDDRPLTPADGSFEIRGIPFDVDTNVSFEKSGYVKQERKLRAGHDDATLDITLIDGLTVTGHVVDKAGAARAGITVTASSVAHGAEMASATTEEDGAFRLEGLASARYDIVVERTPSGERGAVKDVDVAKTHEIIIRLEKVSTAVIFGRVTGLDPSDQSPMTQAYVSANTAEGESGMSGIDATGNYRIENAPTGMVDVEAASASPRGGHRSSKVTVELQPGAELRVDLVFPRQVSVRGHVTRGGGPLAGAKVEFNANSAAGALSGADGGYQAALDPGEYDVSLSMDEKRLPFTQHVVIKEASELDFHVDAATVSATVVDAESGEPVAGAKVTLSPRGETQELASAVTGRDGMTSIDVQQGIPLTVIASMSGYANASDDLTPSGSAAVTLKLLRTPGAVVRIVDVRDGRTLSGYVIARDASGRVLASADHPDPDGTVTLPIAAGSYRVSASAEGYGSHTVKVTVPSSEVRVPLSRGGNLSIRSAHEVHGTARLIQPDGEEYVRCWCNGIAVIKLETQTAFVDRISPGSYVLEVTLRDSKPKQFPVSVIEGQTTIVPID